jgi:hypothetical protein
MAEHLTIPHVTTKPARTVAPAWFVGDGWGLGVVCGDCRRYLTLKGHAVAPDGTVSPSVVCPHAGCKWHVHLRLDGWTYGVKAADAMVRT